MYTAFVYLSLIKKSKSLYIYIQILGKVTLKHSVSLVSNIEKGISKPPKYLENIIVEAHFHHCFFYH